MDLSGEQLSSIISWAKETPELEAIFLSGTRAKGTATSVSDVDLALSMKGPDPFWRLATFLSHRRAWKTELEKSLGLAVQLERARRGPIPGADYVELWRRA
jgi:predicted nucleotidyltransferase